MIGLIVSTVVTLWITIGQVLTNPYAYPWKPFVTEFCPANNETFINGTITTNSTMNNTNSFFSSDVVLELLKDKVEAQNEIVDDKTYGIYALAFNYFPVFSFLLCLVVSVVLSLIFILLKKRNHFF